MLSLPPTAALSTCKDTNKRAKCQKMFLSTYAQEYLRWSQINGNYLTTILRVAIPVAATACSK